MDICFLQFIQQNAVLTLARHIQQMAGASLIFSLLARGMLIIMCLEQRLLDIQQPFILGQKCLLGKIVEKSPCKFLEDIFTVKMKKT